MEAFINWLAGTQASSFIRDVEWVIPTSQTMHILAVGVVLASSGVIVLRILGLAGAVGTLTAISHRFKPWIWTALAVLTVTGVVQITGEPERALENGTFQLKMVMLAVSLVVMVAFERSVSQGVAFWSRETGERMLLKVAAVGTFLMWCAIAIAGRWIAYTGY